MIVRICIWHVFNSNFFRPETKQVCTTDYTTECNTVQNRQCTTTYVDECTSTTKQDCSIVYDQKCSYVYEDKCTTELVEECKDQIKDPSYFDKIYMFYPSGNIFKKCEKVPRTICRYSILLCIWKNLHVFSNFFWNFRKSCLKKTMTKNKEGFLEQHDG